jgi:alkanesulfonate monooxygenase SsuD/methylene tetrahydromethanopterin reductase-like flavin-dependent oxidoreductase (luciferase family)
MEFGVFNSLYCPKSAVAAGPDPELVEHTRLLDEVTWTRAADQAGFKYTWATEHHFLEEYSHLSANESFLAYLAGVTENIHLGSGIINITPPVNHPARVAERVAMIDHLSGGRFEFGTGRGSSTTEQAGFGIDDHELTKAMFDEALPQIVRMWQEDDYSYEGRFFSMPPRNVLPKPLTRPHPPLWVAAGNPSTFEKAGRMGLGVLCFGISDPEALKPLIEMYKTAIQDAEPVGAYVNDNIMVTTQMLCLEDGGRAKQIATEMTTGYHTSNLFRYLDTFPRPDGIPEWPALIPEPTLDQIEQAVERGLMAIGSPEEVDRCVARYESTGADQLVFGMLSTTMPVEVAVEAVETFGRHLIPAYDKDPVHSTTRQREQQVRPQPV